MTKVRRTLSCWFFFLFNVYVEWKFPLTFYTLHASRTLFYSEFANPIEFGNEISADQKSIILKLAEHIFGRFWIKYINLIVFTATQSCSFWKCWNMSHLLSCIASCSLSLLWGWWINWGEFHPFFCSLAWWWSWEVIRDVLWVFKIKSVGA